MSPRSALMSLTYKRREKREKRVHNRQNFKQRVVGKRAYKSQKRAFESQKRAYEPHKRREKRENVFIAGVKSSVANWVALMNS